MVYATVQDVKALFRPLSEKEEVRANELLPVVCDRLRYHAILVHKDLDQMIMEQPELANVAKSITVDIVARTLMTSTNQEPMTQYSESANGYSVSGSFLVPGGGLFIKKSELAALGLKRQIIGGFDVN